MPNAAMIHGSTGSGKTHYFYECPHCNYSATKNSGRELNMLSRLHEKRCKKAGRTEIGIRAEHINRMAKQAQCHPSAVVNRMMSARREELIGGAAGAPVRRAINVLGVNNKNALQGKGVAKVDYTESLINQLEIEEERGKIGAGKPIKIDIDIQAETMRITDIGVGKKDLIGDHGDMRNGNIRWSSQRAMDRVYEALIDHERGKEGEKIKKKYILRAKGKSAGLEMAFI